MEIEIGRGKKARRAYGFDDIAIVPSRRTRDPDDVDISWKLGDYRFELPLLASAMDGVVSPTTAGILGKLGGLAVLNLEGIFARYEDADEQLERIAALLKKADLVQSTRGAHGGYVLSRAPEEITMDQAVLALEGAIAPMDCFLDDHDGRVQCSHGDDVGTCATKLLWTRVQMGVIRSLQRTTLAELVEFAQSDRPLSLT